MRIKLLILTLLLSGCNSLNGLVKASVSSEERFSAMVQKWSEQKAIQITSEFGSGFPLSSNGAISFIPKNKIDEVYKKLDSNITSTEKELESNGIGLKSLKSIHNVSLLTSNDFNETQLWYKKILAKYSNDFHSSVVLKNTSGRMASDGKSYSTKSMLSYCNSHEIKKGDCKSEPYNRNGNPIAIRFLSDYIENKHPEYSKYFQWLDNTKNQFKKIYSKAAKLGAKHEGKLFLNKASSSGCKNIAKFNFIENFPLAVAIGHSNFRAGKTFAYDLGKFKIIQSLANGVLLSTTYPGSYSAPLIFAYTKEKYPDGYIFQNREQLACVSGTKEYVTVLGARKRVISFQTIQDDTKYHFLMK